MKNEDMDAQRDFEPPFAIRCVWGGGGSYRQQGLGVLGSTRKGIMPGCACADVRAAALRTK